MFTIVISWPQKAPQVMCSPVIPRKESCRPSFPAPGTHLGPIQPPKMIQRGLKRATRAPPYRHSKLSTYCGIFVQRVVLRGVL